MGSVHEWETGETLFTPPTNWNGKHDVGVIATISAKDGEFKVIGSNEDLRFLHRKFILGFGSYVYKMRHNSDFIKQDIILQNSKYSNSIDGTKNWIADITANE